MLAQLNPILLSVLLFTAYLVGIHVLLGDAARLGLGIFRPYRRLEWPKGVQEDDDARFSWTAAQRQAADDIPEHPRPDVPGLPKPGNVVHVEIEEFPARAIATERVDHVNMHGAPR